MNIVALEKMVRRALKGENVVEQANNLHMARAITPAEHKSLNSLSSQIAGNVMLAGSRSGLVAIGSSGYEIDRVWV